MNDRQKSGNKLHMTISKMIVRKTHIAKMMKKTENGNAK